MSEGIPLEQGLRLNGLLSNVFRVTVRGYSIRTRIKTRSLNRMQFRLLMSEGIPLEQGLRHPTKSMVYTH